MPSRWEGFAMVPLEAMMQGRALAASNFGSISELIIDNETGKLFPVGDIEKMVDILRNTTKEEWQNLGQNARMLRKTFQIHKWYPRPLICMKKCLLSKAVNQGYDAQ